ncbi:MAG: hypothetical protein GC190_18865 [Alphaproteobacteria bacterium]|nr:hypothetical protein [Alphaproteobacteria bacterium]
MKHACPAALDNLEDLLVEMRKCENLRERNRGSFYRAGRGFLHFHEDPEGLFADLKLSQDGDFTRFRVSTATERKRFLSAARKAAAS